MMQVFKYAKFTGIAGELLGTYLNVVVSNNCLYVVYRNSEGRVFSVVHEDCCVLPEPKS